MIVTVRMFARAKDLAGSDAIRVELPSGATVARLREQLGKVHPALAGLLDRCAIAVNNEFADPSLPLEETDEIAVLPPVSGG